MSLLATALLVTAILVVLGVLTLGVPWAFAHACGWTRLARVFPAPDDLDGKRYRLRSVGCKNLFLTYGNAVTVTIDPRGLGLWHVLPWHGAVLVPWDRLRAGEPTRFVLRVHRAFEIHGEPDLRLFLFDRLADEVAAEVAVRRSADAGA